MELQWKKLEIHSWLALKVYLGAAAYRALVGSSKSSVIFDIYSPGSTGTRLLASSDSAINDFVDQLHDKVCESYLRAIITAMRM